MFHQAGRVIPLIKKPVSLLLCNVPLFLFLFITAEDRQHVTYSNNNIQSFSVFLKQRHFEGKYITTLHHCICHDIQICDRSYDNGICANFTLMGKEPTKSNLGLTSLLGIDTSFVQAFTSSLGLEGTKKWSYFYSELEDHNPRPSMLNNQLFKFKLVDNSKSID